MTTNVQEIFGSLLLDKKIVASLTAMGFEEPSPIQEQTIPLVLEGSDVIGQAQTGTGKTAAFGIPVVQSITDHRHIQALIMTPTRELAIQVAEEIGKIGRTSKIKALPVYGGQPIDRQIRALRSGVQIVIGTPGRLIDHINRKTIKLDHIKFLVLDEADEMLDMGFVDDMEEIMKNLPAERQTLLFSATMPRPILSLTKKYMKAPKNVTISKEELTVPLIDQYYFETKDKIEGLCRLLDAEIDGKLIIFCRTKKGVDDLAIALGSRGYMAEGLHGDLSQTQRDRVMKKFRDGTADILIATDVAARGIDIDNITHVINFDIPQDPESYVHRIGRTGRAGRKGRSFTLVVGREIYRIRDIERICNTQIKPRMVPSVADITQAKASQIFDQVMEVISNNDLSSLQKKVEDKIEEENITAMELCAGFLKLHLGDDMEALDRGGKAYEVIQKGFSKATACQFIMERYDMDASRAYVFGDSSNDLAMFEYAEHAIAMGRHDSVLDSYAEFVTKTVENDGIAYAMKHYGLI